MLSSLVGIPQWVKYGIAALALAAAVGGFLAWWNAAENKDDENNQAIGRTIEREETTRIILERTEEGNNAREEIERETVAGLGTIAYDQCMRTARTPENCKRFLPQQSTD